MGDLSSGAGGDPKSPIFPKEGKRNILITSALPYVNNVPHLGNIIGCVLSADVFARYCRLRGYNAIYICGADDHKYGMATETKAMEENCTPQQMCDKYDAIHKEVYKWFDISFDGFGHTSTPKQTEVGQAIFKKCLDNNNWLYENTMQQLYCNTCNGFLADQLIEGACSTQCCNNDSARGGQCERCRKLLNPTELQDRRCKVVFPSLPLGTGENWTMVKTIRVTEYLNYEAGKFSKSKSICVFGHDAKDTNSPVEVWRYYLLSHRPEVSDKLFMGADLQAKLNSELQNNLGNFVYGVLSFIAKDPALEDSKGVGYHFIIPNAPGAESHSSTRNFGEMIGDYLEQYLEAMEKVKLKDGLKIAMSISGEGNAYMQASPLWKLYKEDQPSCSVVMRTSVGLVYLLSCLLEPFMPSFCFEVLKQLNLPPEIQISHFYEKGDTERAKRPWEFLPDGHKIGTPEPLFKELKDDEVEFFGKMFAVSQAEAKEHAEQLKKMGISDGRGKKQQPTKSSVEGKLKASAEAEVSIIRLNTHVGRIIKVQKHPDGDSLFVEEIDVGEGQPRTVVSGLVKYIPLEDNQNWTACVLCNLKSATMRDINSQAMVLAASYSDHTKVDNTVNDLPDGVLLLILGHLPVKERVQMQTVCRRWDSLLSSLETFVYCGPLLFHVPKAVTTLLLPGEKVSEAMGRLIFSKETWENENYMDHLSRYSTLLDDVWGGYEYVQEWTKEEFLNELGYEVLSEGKEFN